MTKEIKTESEKLQDNLEPIVNNKEEELDPETQEYVDSLKNKIWKIKKK